MASPFGPSTEGPFHFEQQSQPQMDVRNLFPNQLPKENMSKTYSKKQRQQSATQTL